MNLWKTFWDLVSSVYEKFQCFAWSFNNLQECATDVYIYYTIQFIYLFMFFFNIKYGVFLMRKFILFIWRQNMMVVIYITKTLKKITSIHCFFCWFTQTFCINNLLFMILPCVISVFNFSTHFLSLLHILLFLLLLLASRKLSINPTHTNKFQILKTKCDRTMKIFRQCS